MSFGFERGGKCLDYLSDCKLNRKDCSKGLLLVNDMLILILLMYCHIDSLDEVFLQYPQIKFYCDFNNLMQSFF
jgi:hypothetical protein